MIAIQNALAILVLKVESAYTSVELNQLTILLQEGRAVRLLQLLALLHQKALSVFLLMKKSHFIKNFLAGLLKQLQDGLQVSNISN